MTEAEKKRYWSVELLRRRCLLMVKRMMERKVDGWVLLL